MLNLYESRLKMNIKQIKKLYILNKINKYILYNLKKNKIKVLFPY